MGERIHHCGPEGRRARTTIRQLIKGDRFGHEEEKDAIDHVEKCESCQEIIKKAIEKNETTVYGDSFEGALEEAKQTAFGRSLQSIRDLY